MTVYSSADYSPGAFLYVSVQSDDYGFANCEIRVDGRVVSSNSASGGSFGIATCQSTLGSS